MKHCRMRKSINDVIYIAVILILALNSLKIKQNAFCCFAVVEQFNAEMILKQY